MADSRLSWDQLKKENGSFPFVLFGLSFVKVWQGKVGGKEHIFEFLSPKIFGKIKDVIFCLLKKTHLLMGLFDH